MKAQLLRGMVFSCAALLVCPNVGFAANLLVNSGFENVVPIGEGLPSGAGYWSGDVSEIVAASDGITPLDGSHMLKFIYPYAGPPVGSHGWAQVFQLVDLSAYSSAISAGGTSVTASGYFNRVDLNSETDTRFVVSIAAYEGDPVDFIRTLSIASKSQSIYTDGDTATWEFATKELALPTNTDYVSVCVVAVEDKRDDPTGSEVEFHGHYGDGMSLEFIPEPASASMLILGAVAMLKRRRR